MEALFSGTGLVFLLTLAATFAVTFLARQHAKGISEESLSEQKLNRWLIGLSAGATGNSGFIVTAAVGLGYTFGAQWLLLPIAWLVGDIVFWSLFPGRINTFGREAKAVTISDLVTHKLDAKYATLISILLGLILLVGLTGYTSAQWLAGQKFLAGAFEMSSVNALGLFALIIIAYTSIGGFRGSIYADSFQAIVRIVGTIVALIGVIWFAAQAPVEFGDNLSDAGPDFLNPFAIGGLLSIIGFIIGFAAASIGFGLGQPQIISRYLAGSSASETQAAWWIYIGFIQFTWISMTVFGIILRGVMPGLEDPEAGLSVFFNNNFNAIVAGIIVADIFATIAATSNSLLVALAQTVQRDLLSKIIRPSASSMTVLTLVLGLVTMIVSYFADSTVVFLALSSVSLVGAGLAPAVIVRVMRFPYSGASILMSIIAGAGSALLWKILGHPNAVNEAAIGIVIGLAANVVVAANVRRKALAD